jgi:5'-nucleotidase
MKLLLSNDDGFDAPGLQCLIGSLEEKHKVWVSAPQEQRSAQSHAITLGQPVRVTKRGFGQVSVDGTPADSVYYGLHRLMDEIPDWVVSGVNAGSNLGTDVHYS